VHQSRQQAAREEGSGSNNNNNSAWWRLISCDCGGRENSHEKEE